MATTKKTTKSTKVTKSAKTTNKTKSVKTGKPVQTTVNTRARSSNDRKIAFNVSVEPKLLDRINATCKAQNFKSRSAFVQHVLAQHVK